MSNNVSVNEIQALVAAMMEEGKKKSSSSSKVDLKALALYAGLGWGFLSTLGGASYVGYQWLKGGKDGSGAGTSAVSVLNGTSPGGGMLAVKEVTPTEAREMVGSRVKVRMKIEGDYAPSPTILLLNSMSNYKDPNNLTAVLKGGTYSRGAFVGKTVDIIGQMTTYTNKGTGTITKQLAVDKISIAE